MKKFIPTLLCLFLTVLSAFAQKTEPTQTPKPAEDDDIVKISTNLIQVDVTVTDKDGKVIGDLKPEDFEVFENGKKQEITNFSFISAGSEIKEKTPKSEKLDKNIIPLPPTSIKQEQIRRTIALVVDDLTLSFESTHFVRRALRNFVEEQMQDGDLVAIIRTGAGIGALQQFTNDKRLLYAAIEKVQWNPRGSGGISAFDPISVAAGDLDIPADSSDVHVEEDLDDFRAGVLATGTLGAVNYVIQGMKQLPGRKSVMLVSDGFQLFGRNGGGMVDSSRVLESVRKIIDEANRASVVVYTMDARGLQTLGFKAADNFGSKPLKSEQVVTLDKIESAISDRNTKFFDSQDGLVYLAEETGGFAILNNNDLSGGIRKVLNDQSYYLIGYQPDEQTFNAKSSRFNKLEIKVKRKDTKVRYRSGFFGVSDEQIVNKPSNLTAEQQILKALTSPFGINEINLSLNTVFRADTDYNPSISSFLYISIKDLKFTDEPNGNKKGAFDLLAVSFGDNGAVIDQISKTYTINIKNDAYQKLLDEGIIYFFSFPIKKPGAYQMRVAIRDHQSAKVGSASQFIEVPKLKKKRLALSGIVLENLPYDQWSDQTKVIKESNPLADTALRVFKRSTVLRYGYEIYNAKNDAGQKPQLQAKTRIFRDGKVIHDGKPTPIDLSDQNDMQVVKSAGALSLGTDMIAGDYILQIIVIDTLAKEKKQIASQFVQFELTN